MSGIVHPLMDNQRDAVDPKETVWLSASAGTGKTQVLSARVLRLLLQEDVDPSQILCLTFTKAGAAEMAVRVNDVLARWVRMKDEALAEDLAAIGAPVSPETRARARTLFTSVLDCLGGGLRIDTIHAFSQWLLSAFPEEVGLTPGTRAMEDRERDLLVREVLGQLLADAQAAGDGVTLDTLAALSLRMGPDAVEGWLFRCAQARDLWIGPGAWMPPLADRVRSVLGLGPDAGEHDLAALCTDNAFDLGSLSQCLSMLENWDSKTGREGAEAIRYWLTLEPVQRARSIDGFYGKIFNRDGSDNQHMAKRDPEYPAYIARVRDCVERVAELRALLDLAEWLTPALELGRRFALAWDEAKAREGLIDFDDQIRRASELLTKSDLSEWIGYKLDRRFDHILVDEAQDTNEAQWQIIDALTEEFFAGKGQRDGKTRTLFVVGDYKQAIFRFQGTSPENFALARDRVQARMDAAFHAAQESRERNDARPLRELELQRSFRTSQTVLKFVDGAIAQIGHARFGLDRPPDAHVGEERPGLVALWKPVGAENSDATEEGSDEGGFLSAPERRMADLIARQVRSWLDKGFPLAKSSPGRNAGPGDIMVLVRKRRELAGLIVARLYAAGVPVAGVDRLRLGAPLAVKDLMAALRFAAQPLDDLNLANLLVSPLVGWTQEDLLTHGWRKRGMRLWEHLRSSEDGLVRDTLVRLGQLLALADYEPPQALLHWILVGPWRGRRNLVARLGREANDPIDELLNAALQYAATLTPSLQGFIQWFDAGEGELKREAGASQGLVRVMTVHGSKGLEAPIVILADAAGNPDDSPVRGIELEEPSIGGRVRKLPLPNLSKPEKVGRIAQAEADAAAREREEHWRLLYVAMTRAQEALFIGGALSARDKGVPAQESWFAQVRPMFEGDAIADPIWGEHWELGGIADASAVREGPPSAATIALPAWATRPIGPEPRPPRPLAPSSAGEDLSAEPPFSGAHAVDAARRGTLIHKLLERLPDVSAEHRRDAALRWLARQAGDLPEQSRDELAQSALRVLDTERWAEIFSPEALAEVPLAAIVGGQAIAGTADRLLVTANSVLVVDFKTTARPPRGAAEIPQANLRQMAAYAAALETIYPGRKVRTALLYSHTPELFELAEDVLALHKANLGNVQ